MAINLANWSWAADIALDYGAPMLAAAFGIPGPVSTFAIGALKRALGLKASAPPEEVKAAVEADPAIAREAFQAAQTETTAKYAYLTRLVEVQGEVAKTNTEQVNETMRVESQVAAARPDGWWGHWRQRMAEILAYEAPMWSALFATCILFNPWGSFDRLLASVGLLSMFFGGRFGVLGVHIWQGSNERQVAMTGQPVGSVAPAIPTPKAPVGKVGR